MANSYNSLPIIIDTVMASGWRSLQTRNVGNLPANAQQTSGVVTRQWGINVTAVIWTGATTAAHTFNVVDPNDGTVLLAGVAGTTLVDAEYTFDIVAPWRDFKVTQISSGRLFFWFR